MARQKGYRVACMHLLPGAATPPAANIPASLPPITVAGAGTADGSAIENAAYLSPESVGVAAAAQTYYGKDVNDINLEAVDI